METSSEVHVQNVRGHVKYIKAVLPLYAKVEHIEFLITQSTVVYYTDVGRKTAAKSVLM